MLFRSENKANSRILTHASATHIASSILETYGMFFLSVKLFLFNIIILPFVMENSKSIDILLFILNIIPHTRAFVKENREFFVKIM